MLEGITFDRERLAAAAADELIAATDVADLLVRRGIPFRQSHGIVAGLVREALAAGRPLSYAHARGARAPLRRARRRVLRGARAAVVARVEGVGGRHGARARARAARPRARGARRPARVTLPRRRSTTGPSLAVARDLVGCTLAHGDTAGVIVETEAYHESEPACHAHVGPTRATHVLFRRARDRLRLPLLRHPRARQRRLRAGRGRRRRADPGAGADRGPRADARAPRRGTRRAALLGPGQAHAGARRRARAQRRPTSSSGRCGSARGPPGWEDAVVTGPRIGITKAAELPWRFCAAGSRSVSRPWPPGLRRGAATAAGAPPAPVVAGAPLLARAARARPARRGAGASGVGVSRGRVASGARLAGAAAVARRRPRRSGRPRRGRGRGSARRAGRQRRGRRRAARHAVVVAVLVLVGRVPLSWSRASTNVARSTPG